MKIDKKYFLQLYWEECKYDVKKKKVSSFTDTELVLNDSDYDQQYFKRSWECFMIVNSKHDIQTKSNLTPEQYCSTCGV